MFSVSIVVEEEVPQQTYYIVQQTPETGDHAYNAFNEAYTEASQTESQTEYKFVPAVSAGGNHF